MSTGTNTIAARVRSFFEANPDEMLTYADMEAKFGLTHRQALSLVDRLQREGVVERAVCIWANPLRRLGEP